MTTLRYAVHEIHTADEKFHNEVFDIDTVFGKNAEAELASLETIGAVRAASKEELALYEITSGKKAPKADKDAAEKAAVEQEAADKAAKELADAAAAEQAQKDAAAAEAADKAAVAKKAPAKGGKEEDFA